MMDHQRARNRRLRGSALSAAAAAFALMALASPAASQGAAAGGAFDEYASGPSLGYTDISGRAELVRTGDGSTIVTIEVQGLNPGVTYASHVHDAPCDQGNGGAHYFFDGPVPDGDGPAGDEIWPGPVTANPAGNAHGKTVVGATAGPEAVSVVVHAPGGARIACADLS